MPNSAVATSVKGATVLVLLQVSSRALTFILNQTLLRIISPELLAVATQLELYSISVLYFSRESVRVAVQRQPDDVQTVVNLSYISLALGPVFALVLGTLYLRSANYPVLYVRESLIIYGFACLVELLSEPGFVAAQQKLLYGIRGSVESFATIVKCLIICGLAFWAHINGLNYGVLPFAYGQLAFATTLFLGYTVRVSRLAAKQNFSLILRKIRPQPSEIHYFNAFSRSLCSLVFSLSLQSSVKYILTQGDSLIMANLTTLHDQGAYALAANYGGLIARMVFQPIEESTRNVFARLCASESNVTEPKEQINQAKVLLQDILRIYSLMSLVAVVAGPVAAPLLLQLVAGSKWIETGSGEMLSTYCFYIPLLALNGVTEAFVAAVANKQQLYRQSVYMGLFFAAFAGSAFLFLHTWSLGGHGVVYANCLNMGLRIFWNISFIKDFFNHRKLSFTISTSLPSYGSQGIAIAFWALLRNRRLYASTLLGSLVRVGLAVGVYLALLLLFERTFLWGLVQNIRGQRTSERS
ncbi:Rft-1-domain-containing protein [Eremomyces bilateralis CBS 781.70]|uniref:Man(5)GlcNAc(2)-PP-dolichol translocation protein RFT1 n=1 Tax=Eremomyces bilateralis CBS 781.70 TaxID=1392243 RepID=A0A6G1FT07_9PEZI|nr:Rft-1-domain-containing protein [Eremomyces bilateralis CBS 781.70]KAF1809005.1 Rft-1-domain-containing protein [Eremomyces bilateralis CBS 781.70]